MIVPLPASVSRGDQLVNAEVFAKGEGRLVVPDDAELRLTLGEACLKLAALHQADHRVPDEAEIRVAAHAVAERVIALGRRRRRPQHRSRPVRGSGRQARR